MKTRENIGSLRTKMNQTINVSPYMFVVIKVERVSYDDINEGYVFPNENDNLTGYAGGRTHLMVPSGLLQDISKYDNWPQPHRVLLLNFDNTPCICCSVSLVTAYQIFYKFTIMFYQELNLYKRRMSNCTNTVLSNICKCLLCSVHSCAYCQLSISKKTDYF